MKEYELRIKSKSYKEIVKLGKLIVDKIPEVKKFSIIELKTEGVKK